jgi:hypothetical protein
LPVAIAQTLLPVIPNPPTGAAAMGNNRTAPAAFLG